jgi:hypothetical protein
VVTIATNRVQRFSAYAATLCVVGAIAPFGLPSALADSGVVLGEPMDQYSVGFGSDRPSLLSQNSLCGNTITDVTWVSWGGPTAQGAGTWCQSVGDISRGEAPVPVSITASGIGPCNGAVAYRVLQYDSGEPFSICNG